ncbi:MAG: helix-turn-helix transcriptional regulator [Clostridiales bacterium]
MKNNNIKNNLRKYRVWKTLTQEQLAMELGVSLAQIRLIENKHHYPRYQTRSKICVFFNINQNQMFYKVGANDEVNI